MDIDRVGALKAERDEVVRLCRTLTDEEWATPSRCDGWTVKDVVSHMGAAAHGTFTPWVVKMMRTKDIEGNNDADVEKRRAWEPKKVFGEYEKWSRRFAGMQRPLQMAPMSLLPIRVGEVGTYPAKMLTSAIVFDSSVHLRYDIATALGKTVPPSDGKRMAATLEWMMAGMPAMSGTSLDWLDRPVQITLSGDGGGTWSVVPKPGGHPTVSSGEAGNPAASVHAAADGFPIWGTRREAWRSRDVTVSGDEELATRFLDSFRVI